MNGKDKQLFEEISRLKINNKEKNIVHKNQVGNKQKRKTFVQQKKLGLIYKAKINICVKKYLILR